MNNFEEFINPNDIYHGTDFWMLNGRLEEDEIERQLKGMYSQGVRSIIARTYVGLESDYPGPDFKKKLRKIIETAKKLGVKIFLQACYMPEHVPNLPKEYTLNYLMIHKAENETLNQTILCRYGDIVICEYLDSKTLDMFNQDSMSYYIQTCYEDAWKEVSSEYGKTIQSVWVDEPSYAIEYLPYPRGIEERFLAKWGYSLKENLYKLYFDVENYKSVRYHYHKILQDLMEVHYFSAIQNWCHQNGLWASGHFMMEERLSWQTGRAGAVMPFYAYLDIPGMDVLKGEMNWTTTPLLPEWNQPYSHRAEVYVTPKQCVSAARQAGKKHILCEMYAVTTQDMTFRNQKYVFDSLAVHGINHRSVHGIFYSLKGRGKRAYPPQLNYYQPYFNDLHLIYDYVASTSSFVSIGEPDSEVLVIHPLDSAFCDYTPEFSHKVTGNIEAINKMREKDKDFLTLTSLLCLSNIVYDYGDERTIERVGKVEKGNFIVGEMKYKTVVLPSLYTLQNNTLRLLKEFSKNGGNIIVLGDLPFMIDGNRPDNDVLQGILFQQVKKVGDLIPLLQNKRYFYTDSEGYNKVLLSARKENDCEYYFLFNTDCATARNGVFTVVGNKKLEIWDAVKRKKVRLASTFDGVNTTTQISIVEGGSILLVAYPAKSNVEDCTAVECDIDTKITINKPWTMRRKDKNVLVLEFCRYKKQDGKYSNDLPILNVQKRLTQENYHGPLTLEFCFDADFEIEGLGLSVEDIEKYKVSFNGENVLIKVDGYFKERNFKTIRLPKARIGKNVLELTIDYMPLTNLKYAMDALYTTRSGVELEAVYLTGDFAISVIKEPCLNGDLRYSRQMVLTKEKGEFYGELTSAGYPFYGGAIEIETTFSFNEEKEKIDIELDWLNACVCHVELNGVVCGSIYAAPYRLDISKAIQKGTNKLKLTINNTLRNMLGPYHRPQGEVGCLFSNYSDTDGPWIWDPNSPLEWQENRVRDNVAWTDSYMCVPFGIKNIVLSIRR